MANQQTTQRRIPVQRRLLYGAIVTVMFFALTEGILWALGIRPAADTRDLFVGFSDGQPLFVKDGDTYKTNDLKKSFFNTEQFACEKPADTVRVFSLGGSTTYGHPFDTRPSYNVWVEELVNASQPDLKCEVINCGGISYASYRLAHLSAELARYDPDLFIVYTGHNEFLEDRTYGEVKSRNSLLNAALQAASNLRTFELALNVAERLQPATQQGSVLAPEVDTILETNGPQTYERDDEHQAQVVAHYRDSLRRIVAIARDAGAKVLFVKPACNLRDFSPFNGQHTDLTDVQIKSHAEAIDAACAALMQGDRESAEAHIREAQQIDPRHADSLWRLGQAWLTAGDKERARDCFIRSRDEDICPLRAISEIEDAMDEVARELNVSLIDYPSLLATKCREELGHSIVGMECFMDHVHPNTASHALLGEAIVDRMKDLQVIGKTPLTAAHKATVREKIAKSLTNNDTALALNNLAMTLSWAQKNEEALKISDIAFQLLPSNSEVLQQRARILEKLGRGEESAALNQQALTQNPNNSEALLASSRRLWEQGAHAEAIETLRQAVKSLPERAPVGEKVRYRLVLAWALNESDQKEEAKQLIQAALAINPQSKDAQAAMADLFPEQ